MRQRLRQQTHGWITLTKHVIYETEAIESMSLWNLDYAIIQI